MSQSKGAALGADVQEARILYVPGCNYHTHGKLRVPHIVHRLIWNVDKDRARCLSRRVIYPDIRHEYFRLVDYAAVAVAATALEVALNSIETTMYVDTWFEETLEDQEAVNDQAEDDQATTYTPTKEPAYHRWIDLPTWPVRMDLLFSTSQTRRYEFKGAAEFNHAWERLWDALGASFVETNRLQRVTISSFDPSPRKYARALASMYEDA